ncbi:carbohydrate ABC transporter permease [Paenibacillus sp. 7124]|uniref:Carbohydrate ABC transporter permease n=1 Tax=Paenibacillus apii TaxID=1850370 RepID=A0A6M1PQK2_9BACL|nr:carbohydrate ABC transporter permease [Paenibacillus apii]NGM84634.1 carbohydrate ABC transporter permease [Paenibacillus apii]
MNKSIKKILLFSGVVLVMIFTLSPLIWAFIISLSPGKELGSLARQWLPDSFTLMNYKQVLSLSDNAASFKNSLLNSLIVASVTTLFSLIFGSLGAYAFARLRFRMKDRLAVIFLITQMVPSIAIALPMYLIFNRIGLLDTKSALVLANLSFTLPFIIWMMRAFFESIPKELEESAFVDGLGRFGALLRIILPISAPGLFAIGVFAYLNTWNEFNTALVLTGSSQSKTMPVVINEFLGRFSVDYGLMAASGIIGLLPPVLLTLFFQRYLVDGMTAGAVKG